MIRFFCVYRAFPAQPALARDLEMVIRQGRDMIHGDMRGRPLGQVAFQILQDRLDGTNVAERNRCWFICREQCEP